MKTKQTPSKSARPAAKPSPEPLRIALPEEPQTPSQRPSRPNLGERVWKIRQENNWTLQEMSRRTGVSASTLSKLENGLIDVTFETVMKICDGLDLSLEHLTNHEQAPFRTGVRTVTRRNEGLLLGTRDYGFEVLCTDIAKKGLLPVIVTVKARSISDIVRQSRHAGEEFIYVIRGRMWLHTEFYEPTLLKEGDAAYYDSSGSHAFVNDGDQEAIVLSVNLDSTGKHRGVTGHLDKDL